MKSINQLNLLYAFLRRVLKLGFAACFVLLFTTSQGLQAQLADFTNTVTLLPGGTPTLTNDITIEAGDSFELVIGVSAPDGMLIGSVTTSLNWDGNYLSLATISDATTDGVGGSWFALGSQFPIVDLPNGDVFGQITWSKGDLFGSSPGSGDFPFLRMIFTANADLQGVNLTDIVHLATGAKASLITQPNVPQEETNVTGVIPDLAVVIQDVSSCEDCGDIIVSVDGITSNCGEIEAQALLYETGTNVFVSTSTVTIDSEGNFTIPEVDPGSYDLYVKPDRYLRVGTSGLTVVSGENTVDLGSLVIGDIDGISDEVDGFNQIGNGDLNLLFSAWNSIPGATNFNVRADLNCDNEVGNADLNLFFNAWNQVGVSLPSDD